MSLDLPSQDLSDALAAGVAGFPRDQADRAARALRLAAGRGSDAGRSDLTGDGFPLELSFATADRSLRWTFDPAPAGPTSAARLDGALAGLARLGAPLEAPLAALAARLQAGRADGFGGWVAGRHDAAGDRFKLYVDMPDGPVAEAALRALDLPRPRSAGAAPRTRMLGLEPGRDRAEVYFRVEATPWSLQRLLDPAGRADDAGELLDLVAEAWGHPIRERLPGGQVGVSYARTGGGAPVFTLFLFARTLWGGDGRIRERMTARLSAAGAPTAPYEAATAALAGRRVARTRHGLVGVTLGPDRTEWSVGLRPTAPPC